MHCFVTFFIMIGSIIITLATPEFTFVYNTIAM